LTNRIALFGFGGRNGDTFEWGGSGNMREGVKYQKETRERESSLAKVDRTVGKASNKIGFNPLGATRWPPEREKNP
jgi:hypothetical protein